MRDNWNEMYQLKLLLDEFSRTSPLTSRTYNILVKNGIKSVEKLAECDPDRLAAILLRTKGAGDCVKHVALKAKEKADRMPRAAGAKYRLGDIVEYCQSEEETAIRYLIYGYLPMTAQYQVLRVIRSPGFDGGISHRCLDAEFINRNGRLVGRADLSPLVCGMDILHGLEVS